MGVDSFEHLFDTGRDGYSLHGPERGPGDPSIALGSGRARLRGRGPRGTGDGAHRGVGRGVPKLPAGGWRGEAAWGRPSARGRPPGRSGPDPLDRLRRPRRDPRPRRRAAGHGRVDAGRRLERPDDAGAAACGRGPGRRLDRRLAGPDRGARPGRGRRPRDPAGVAGGRDPGRPRGGAGDRRLAARGPSGGPAGHRPAGETAEAGACEQRHTPEQRRVPECPHTCGPRRCGSEIRRSTRSAGRARAPCRHHPRGARAAERDGGGSSRIEWCRRRRDRRGGRRRRGDGDPAGAGPSVVDPARPGRGRPANGGDRRPQPGRPTGPASDPPDPVRRRRGARRLPPPRRLAQ